MAIKRDAILQALDKLNQDLEAINKQARAIAEMSDGFFLATTVQKLEELREALVTDTISSKNMLDLMDLI